MSVITFLKSIMREYSKVRRCGVEWGGVCRCINEVRVGVKRR